MFTPLGIQQFSHSLGVAQLHITDETGSVVYGRTLFANTGPFTCPLPGVPISLLKANGQTMTTVSGADGAFSFSITLGESVTVWIPPYQGFSWSTALSLGQGIPAPAAAGPTSAPTYQSAAGITSTTAAPTTSKSSTSPKLPPKTLAPTTSQEFPALIHRFTFDTTLASNQNQVPDMSSPNDVASMHNGVFLQNSKAMFPVASNMMAKPYLSFAEGLFGSANAISIELWISVDSATQNSAVICSFGDANEAGGRILLTAAGLQGIVNTYVAIVIDTISGISTTYINGTVISTVAISSNLLFNGEGNNETHNYVGWDVSKYTPGFIGSIDELRMWTGALPASAIAETFSVGMDPSKVFIKGDYTKFNVQLEYYVTSQVVTNVGFYGGSSKNKMFGSESAFMIKAIDPQCGFTANLTLDPFSSSNAILLPAMNYTVELLPYATPLPPPTFTKASLCSPSLGPYEYLQSADQLSVQIFTNLLATYNLYATFIYHTGVCMAIAGAEHFLTTPPEPGVDGETCYDTSVTLLVRGQQWPLNITLFEVYPAYTGDTSWISAGALGLSAGTAVADLIILDSSLEIADVVSGYPSAKTYAYNDLPFSTKIEGATLPSIPFNYTIVAGPPLPNAPYALPFRVTAIRNGPEGLVTLPYNAFIPIIGTIPAEVPNFYPISTDPTLIFMVLRDPPGGNSFVTIEAGTTFTTGISINGMRAFEKSVDGFIAGSAGAAMDTTEIVAPLGGGLNIDQKNSFYITAGLTSSFQGPKVSATRSSDATYDYSFNFAYDFSTSSDPYIAGHPSDIIIGGGADIIVSEALEGNLCQLSEAV